ncbi:MAG: hypothetical protein AAF483_20170 [Planctomycetota bacterium]
MWQLYQRQSANHTRFTPVRGAAAEHTDLICLRLSLDQLLTLAEFIDPS